MLGDGAGGNVHRVCSPRPGRARTGRGPGVWGSDHPRRVRLGDDAEIYKQHNVTKRCINKLEGYPAASRNENGTTCIAEPSTLH